MVLKLLLSILFFHTFFAISEEVDIRSLEIQFKMKNYDELMSLIEDIEENIDLNKNYKVLEYKALVLENEKDFAAVRSIYKKLINIRFKTINEKIMKSLSENKKVNLNFEDFHDFKFYYMKLSSNALNEYENANRAMSSKQILKLKKSSTDYLNLLKKIEQSDDTSILEERLIKKNKFFKDHKYESSYYVFLSYLTWQDFLIVTKKDNTGRTKVLNTNSASCSGGGISRENRLYNWFFETCLVIGKANSFDEPGGALGFKQASVPIKGLFGGVGVLNKYWAENLQIGGQLNYFYKTGQWDGKRLFVINEDKYIRFGLSLKASWKIGDFSLMSSMGKIFRNKSSIIHLGTAYKF